ncbi:HAD family hydrolase [Citrobacter sp. RHBSTW-00881]|jgi:predicted HAD superfamily hydrolase|nr:haloacid dehalogenase [Citrobacter sp. RHBSTW-00881]QLS64703.1 haloacid dehalogenase [Citrobacter sp. RHBSTW-00881]
MLMKTILGPEYTRYSQAINSFKNLSLTVLNDAEVISFDFFDTIFTRPIADPEDVFEILGRKLNIDNFKVKRQQAQVEAFRQMTARGKKEITIDDIYAAFTDNTIPAEKMIEAEYQLELALVEPNKIIFDLFKRLKAVGKTVIVTSDMYLPARFFEQALDKYGVTGVKVFSSADENATKRDAGILFDVIAKKLNVRHDHILHVGDNEVSDVIRPREKGLQAFHYRSHYLGTISKGLPLALSFAQGMLKNHEGYHSLQEYKSLGFAYGGAASLGFLKWIKNQAAIQEIDHVFFLARDGYIMQKMVERGDIGTFPDSTYFYGSRTSLTLATINDQNFVQYIPFLLSGSEGLQPREVLERIGVTPPAPEVMASFGLSDETPLTSSLFPLMSKFLYAWRWQILQVCRKNRRGLFNYIQKLGIKQGEKIALVDVGWSGTTQEAFYHALKQFIDIDIFGYYFCLSNTTEKLRRKSFLKMFAMYESDNADASLIDTIYENRVAVELFFSAPHDSIIGYDAITSVPVGDKGRGLQSDISQSVRDICDGALLFSLSYQQLCQKLNFDLTPYELTLGMLNLVQNNNWKKFSAITEVSNFDAWGSSRLKSLCVKDYLVS